MIYSKMIFFKNTDLMKLEPKNSIFQEFGLMMKTKGRT